jgi:uncharacterized protein (DUF433 family)
MKFTRITVRQDQMGGVPCIRGLRIPVATVVGMVANRMTDAEILAAFPDLEPDDIQEALPARQRPARPAGGSGGHYAALAVRERQVPVTDKQSTP